MQSSRVTDCKLMDLPMIHNLAGNITPLQGMIDVPFEIKRVYYLYDVPGGAYRGGHAHRQLRQLIIAASGSFSVVLDDGNSKTSVFLNRPNKGLLIVPGIWRELEDFSSGAICLVLASEIYDQEDYIRDYEKFLILKNDDTSDI